MSKTETIRCLQQYVFARYKVIERNLSKKEFKTVIKTLLIHNIKY